MSLTPEVCGSDCMYVLQVCQPTSSVVLNCAEIEIQAATCGGQGMMSFTWILNIEL